MNKHFLLAVRTDGRPFSFVKEKVRQGSNTEKTQTSSRRIAPIQLLPLPNRHLRNTALEFASSFSDGKWDILKQAEAREMRCQQLFWRLRRGRVLSILTEAADKKNKLHPALKIGTASF